jgi:hypothetical protein
MWGMSVGVPILAMISRQSVGLMRNDRRYAYLVAVLVAIWVIFGTWFYYSGGRFIGGGNGHDGPQLSIPIDARP